MKEIRLRAIYHLLLITSFLATLLGSAAFPIPVQAATLDVTSPARFRSRHPAPGGAGCCLRRYDHFQRDRDDHTPLPNQH